MGCFREVRSVRLKVECIMSRIHETVVKEMDFSDVVTQVWGGRLSCFFLKLF